MTDTTAPMAQDLPAQIMNLRCEGPEGMPILRVLAYKTGHRDARHAAAELAAAALAQRDARIRELEAALRDTLDFCERHSNRWDGISGKHPAEVVEQARAALAAAPAAAPGWIPVSERLPAFKRANRSYLIWNGHWPESVQARFMDDQWWYAGEQVHPSHWMPLPAAPVIGGAPAPATGEQQ